MLEWLKKKIFMLRVRVAFRLWPLSRFLPTTDLEFSEDEKRELKFGSHSWRQLVPRYLARFDSMADGRQFYCFGVAHGSTVYGLATGLRDRGMEIPHMHLFDSFQGLPSETANISRPSVWHVGAYAAPRTKLERSIESLNLSADRYSIHDGWFKDTLKAEHVASGVFKPAAYIDIDADLYSSTYEVLDFLFAHKLIVPGTLIGYDDWGDTEAWTAGESRAHKEIIAKYDARCAQLFSWGQHPLMRKLFLVVSVKSQSI